MKNKINKIIRIKEEKISDWNINICKCDNGYLCTWKEDGVKRSQVFEIKEDNPDENKDELIAMKELLLFIKEHFGVYYSKHDKLNLEIDIKEDEDKDKN